MRYTKLVAASCILFSVGAQAQSSVSLYGIIDTGLTYVNNRGGHSIVYMDSGITQGSRWGLLGKEDLGGGTSVIFNLENRFTLHNGASSAMFGGWSYVGLQSDRWGTLTFGRQYDFMAYLVLYANAMSGIYGGHPYDSDRLAGEFVNNSVRYLTPLFAGVQAGALYGFSNAAGAFGGTAGSPRTVSFTLNYQRDDPLSWYLAYTKADGYGGSAASVLLGDATSTTGGLGVRYTFGSSAIYALIDHSRLSDPLSGGKTLSATNADVGVRYSVTPALYFYPSYSYMKTGEAKAHQFNLGVDYLLSKRTDLYALVAYQKSATAGYPAGILWITSLTSPNMGYSTTDKQLAFRIAIRTRF
ncbi:porin [Paraburkholderia antibiotica]|uniref:Porin n=1 Tax=Paraburkholderia antibiotica TaxID=2728839 RepID=A0A7X9X342_9BURK|nr:porin [Paraburkholderia antibiotica]NML30521.1 porin [Paraburkholderia antibiotica]